jgi:hypothetical protein
MRRVCHFHDEFRVRNNVRRRLAMDLLLRMGTAKRIEILLGDCPQTQRKSKLDLAPQLARFGVANLNFIRRRRTKQVEMLAMFGGYNWKLIFVGTR